MQIISRIIQQSTAPERHDVIWVDCSDVKNPIAKIYKDNEWVELDSGNDLQDDE